MTNKKQQQKKVNKGKIDNVQDSVMSFLIKKWMWVVTCLYISLQKTNKQNTRMGQTPNH